MQPTSTESGAELEGVGNPIVADGNRAPVGVDRALDRGVSSFSQSPFTPSVLMLTHALMAGVFADDLRRGGQRG